MKRVLFISPYMGRTGSESAVLQIINNCTQIQPALYSGQKGDLLNEVKSGIPVFINPLININKNRVQKINNKLGIKTPFEKYLDKIQKDFNPDLWLLNTLVNKDVLKYIQKFNLNFAVWSHELFSSFENISGFDLKYIIDNAKFIIGCSMQVCKQFEKVGSKNVNLFYETIEISKINKFFNSAANNKKEIGQYKYLFVMSGQKGYRKGFHYVPIIAEKLKKENSALIWIGRSNEYGLEALITEQLKCLNLTNVIFTGEQSTDYYNWLNLGDYFILTSIEDAYPLVMLEAAYLQKPIISFDSGGVGEFVKEGMGKVVPLFDVNSLYNAIDDIIQGRINIDKTLLRSEAEKHDIRIQVNRFENIILKNI